MAPEGRERSPATPPASFDVAEVRPVALRPIEARALVIERPVRGSHESRLSRGTRIQSRNDGAQKLAKYALKLKGGTAEEKKEAQFNLDMVRASIAAYFHQKQIVAEKGVEQIATQVAGLIVKLVIAAV